jgi:hypothetical protein
MWYQIGYRFRTNNGPLDFMYPQAGNTFWARNVDGSRKYPVMKRANFSRPDKNGYYSVRESDLLPATESGF